MERKQTSTKSAYSFIFETGSGWHGTPYVHQGDLELIKIHLLLPLMCWDYITLGRKYITHEKNRQSKKGGGGEELKTDFLS